MKTETTKTPAQELEALENEAATLAGAIREAAEAADGEALHKLQMRANALHMLVPASRLKLAKERLAQLEAKQQQTVGKNESEKTKAEREFEEANAALATATARVASARQVLWQLHETQQGLMMDIAQAKRDVGDLQHELAAGAQTMGVKNLAAI